MGSSPAIARLREAIARVAPIPSPVLIIGESGSGKELVARDLHRLGAGASGPFVAINCAALPEKLVESELFGHERGAFTGAATTRKGAFEAAERGTLFLDEIGELPLAGAGQAPARARGAPGYPARRQPLDSGRGPGRGGHQSRSRGRGRRPAGSGQDLYYRLNVHLVRVPPLRERLSDIPRAGRRGSSRPSASASASASRSSPATRSMVLMGYDWRQNNVRELRNVIERMIIAADGDVLRPEHVPFEIHGKRAGRRPASRGERSFQELRTEAERQIVIAALERNELAHHPHRRGAGSRRSRQPAQDHAPAGGEERVELLSSVSRRTRATLPRRVHRNTIAPSIRLASSFN